MYGIKLIAQPDACNDTLSSGVKKSLVDRFNPQTETLAPLQTAALAGSSKFLVTISTNSNVSGRRGYSIISGAYSQSDSIDFGIARYNLGTDFTINTADTINNFIRINNDGLYHFEGSLSFSISHLTTALKPNAEVRLKYNTGLPGQNGLTQLLAESVPFTQITSSSVQKYVLRINFTTDLFLTANTTFTLEAGISNITSYPLNSISTGSAGYLSGYRIAD